MERIERVVEQYFKAFDGVKFTNEEDCLRYEKICDKFLTKQRHALLENTDGALCHFFYIENMTDAYEIEILCRHKYHIYMQTPANLLDDCPGWFFAGSSAWDYDYAPAFLPLSTYIMDIEETIQNYRDELEQCRKLMEVTNADPRSN